MPKKKHKNSMTPLYRKLAENLKFWPNLFGSKLAEMKILLCKWHMAIKTYFNFFFSFLIEKFDFPVKMPP